MDIQINLDIEMARSKMSLTELSQRIGISMTNLSLLKNGKVKGIRFATLAAICEALQCQPGDILSYPKPQASSADGVNAETARGTLHE
ncbi:MAG: helix-turn-helix transcriptional regulator [Pseudomonadota bacterium]